MTKSLDILSFKIIIYNLFCIYNFQVKQAPQCVASGRRYFHGTRLERSKLVRSKIKGKLIKKVQTKKDTKQL